MQQVGLASAQDNISKNSPSNTSVRPPHPPTPFTHTPTTYLPPPPTSIPPAYFSPIKLISNT